RAFLRAPVRADLTRIIGILQARLASTRLAKKMLLPLGSATVIEYVLERLKRSRAVPMWVLATSTAPEDDVLAALAEARSIPVFRGSASDVLDRLYQCAQRFDASVVVRAGGDNPLLDPAIVDMTVDAFFESPDRWDYFSNHHPPTFPDGQEIEIVP